MHAANRESFGASEVSTTSKLKVILRLSRVAAKGVKYCCEPLPSLAAAVGWLTPRRQRPTSSYFYLFDSRTVSIRFDKLGLLWISADYCGFLWTLSRALGCSGSRACLVVLSRSRAHACSAQAQRLTRTIVCGK